MKNQEGYTLTELLIVTANISVLAAVAIPQFYPFKTQAYDADTKANLHNVFLSCKGYWTFNNSNTPCVLSTVSNNEYGFIQSDAVEVVSENNNNTESDFIASASHIWSSNGYEIDYRGAITATSGGGGKSSKDDKITAREKKKKEKEAAKEKMKVSSTINLPPPENFIFWGV